MRADAERNIDAVLRTGARLLAEDATTSIAEIAREAGVDRRTVYRRFANRDDLLAATFDARLGSAERALDESRLEEAPIVVALHNYVEKIIPVVREWPMGTRAMMRSNQDAWERREQLSRRVDRFVQRMIDEQLLNPDLPARWARIALDSLVDGVAYELPEIAAPQGADLVVSTMLDGIRRS